MQIVTLVVYYWYITLDGILFLYTFLVNEKENVQEYPYNYNI